MSNDWEEKVHSGKKNFTMDCFFGGPQPMPGAIPRASM
jgi:hypothetical protein